GLGQRRVDRQRQFIRCGLRPDGLERMRHENCLRCNAVKLALSAFTHAGQNAPRMNILSALEWGWGVPICNWHRFRCRQRQEKSFRFSRLFSRWLAAGAAGGPPGHGVDLWVASRAKNEGSAEDEDHVGSDSGQIGYAAGSRRRAGSNYKTGIPAGRRWASRSDVHCPATEGAPG